MFDRSTESEKPIAASGGHWTDHEALTGCTVLLFDHAAPAVVDVRGGAPGTRETDLLGPGNLVQSVDAILLTGGSAFGLEAVGGVMSFLQELGRGVSTPAGPVPIVPAAVLYDLSIGSPAWPTSDNAYVACRSAGQIAELSRGQIGAGTGATTRKVFPDRAPMRGGIGVGRVSIDGDASVTAIAAVNAAGEVIVDAAAPDPRQKMLSTPITSADRTSTTLIAVIVDAPVDRRCLVRCATAAHAGLSRVIRPSHTIVDGDSVFAVGLRAGSVEPERILGITVAVELAVEHAIIDAVTV